MRPPSTMLNVLDLFSGIGGFSVGLHRTGGFRTVAFCETDEFCRAILGKHYPEVKCLGDIRNVHYFRRTLRESVEHGAYTDVWTTKGGIGIDVVCGGFPCQDISVAGKQEGIDGKRSGLWKEMFRLIDETRPGYAVIENVAALRNNGLATVLKDIWSIGYDAEWNIVSAAEVGAPHLRERIWIVAYPGGGEHDNVVCEEVSAQQEIHRPKNRIFTADFVSNLRGRAIAHALDAGAEGQYRGQDEVPERRERGEDTGVREAPNAYGPRLETQGSEQSPAGIAGRDQGGGSHWETVEPPVCGVDDGLPIGMDRAHNARGLKAVIERERKERIKALGNSIVPEIAKLIGLAILKDWGRGA